MKQYKLFQIGYASNFLFCAWVDALIAYRLLNGGLKDEIGMIALVCTVVATTIYFIFDWQCHHLIQSLKTGRLLSNRSKITGSIFSIASLPVTCFLAYGIYTMISLLIRYPLYRAQRNLTIVPFLGVVITSIYSVISYWILRKRLAASITKEIDSLGMDV